MRLWKKRAEEAEVRHQAYVWNTRHGDELNAAGRDGMSARELQLLYWNRWSEPHAVVFLQGSRVERSAHLLATS